MVFPYNKCNMKVRRLFVEKLNTIHSATGENEKVQLIKSIILYLFHYYAIWLPRDSVNTQVMELWYRSYRFDVSSQTFFVTRCHIPIN